MRLLEESPFPDGPPRFVRLRVYDYRFTTPEERRSIEPDLTSADPSAVFVEDAFSAGKWWHREQRGFLSAPLTLEDLQR